jgi:hypothetical protein
MHVQYDPPAANNPKTQEVVVRAFSRRRGAALAGFTMALVLSGSSLAAAAGPPSSSTLKKIGSSSKAVKTQPKAGLGATLGASPLVAISFSGNKATVLGGSAVSGSSSKRARVSNIPISAAQCLVNFTTKATSAGNQTSAKWFSGISCSQKMFMFGEAFLAESATKFDGSGGYFTGNAFSDLSGHSNTVIKEPHPSLYIWSAINVFFPTKPSRGVIVILPKGNQPINSATTCKVASTTSNGIGVHCDMYTQRF